MSIQLDNYLIQKKWEEWNKYLRWLEDIPDTTEGFIPYPLQLANAIRIMENDAVFIFDEVGCGKTISAGIMAETYLNNLEDGQSDRILVITTNSVKESKQFEEDWKKLDNDILNKVTVFNNLAQSDLWRIEQFSEKWGMVVIDEAHEFNNKDTIRFELIKNNLRADKVIFLTATPLRGGGNFAFYRDLADSILVEPKYDYTKQINIDIWNKRRKYIECLNSLEKNMLENSTEKSLLCSVFDPSLPLTRYFKDTVRFLDVHEKKAKGHRVIPEVWVPQDQETREDALRRYIVKKAEAYDKSKFLIFVSRKFEAEAIKKALDNCIKKSTDDDRVEIVFSKEKKRLKDYSGLKGGPKVLIVNYQIAEAGINFPGYNHVIHWHISSDPARLEQRYGRIDRMTSAFENLFCCFIVPKAYDSSNYKNFIRAVEFTMEELLTTLPARNVLLTDKTLGLYKDEFDRNREMLTRECDDCKLFIKTLENPSLLDIMYECHCIDGKEEKNVIRERFSFLTEENRNGINWNDFERIIDYLEEIRDRIELEDIDGNKIDKETFKEMIIHILNRRINYLEKRSDITETNVKAFLNLINRIKSDSDKIFYLAKAKNPGALKTVDSQGDKEKSGCATYIESFDNYKMIRDIIKIKDAMRIIKTYLVQDYVFTNGFINDLGKVLYGEEWDTSSIPSELYRLTLLK